tara:strand:+ start:9210 stop:9605 length:396 start_codon:yes stop_codon:yes gene_type:complete
MDNIIQVKKQTYDALKSTIFDNKSLVDKAKEYGISKQLLSFRMKKLSTIALQNIYEDLYELWNNNKDSYNDIEKITVKRKLLGMSQQNVCNRLQEKKYQISKSTIAHVETGRIKLSSDLKKQLFELLEIDS